MRLSCRACGLDVDPLGPAPWACPNRDADRADHVLVVPLPAAHIIDLGSQNPFVRYRSSLASHSAALAAGVTDAAFVELVGELDGAVAGVWGRGFEVTSMTAASGPVGVGVDLLVKDETANVSGSHKGRHLMGLAIWLRLRQYLGVVDPATLAIASCGNAALAAATIAAAIGRPLDVFVPDWADPVVLDRLRALDAQVRVCRRSPGERGDPCVVAFRAAVRAGAAPFGCSGPDVGLTIDGGRTLGWELAEDLISLDGRGDPPVDRVMVQVGGGALATSVLDGLYGGGVDVSVTVVQTAGCAPFDRAWRAVGDLGLAAAVADRSTAMRPWPTDPHSAATGILDDETYDWAGVAEGLLRCGGDSVVVDEVHVLAANRLARRLTDIDVDPTGSAGLAGVLALPPPAGSRVAVLFTGGERRGAKVSG